MNTRVAMVTTYNPGAAGPRYVAGHLQENGHDVKFFHMKELRAVAFPTTDYEKHEELKRYQIDIQYVAFQHPGEVLYVPYPSEITSTEEDLFIQELKAYDPHVVGISMFSVTVNIARRLTKLIHERIPGLPVIWGGIHCMVHPESCLDGLKPHPETGETKKLQVPDIICAAEGEVPMKMLMDRWHEYMAGEVPDVPGMWFVKGDEVHRFARLPFEKDLDTFALPIYAEKEVLIDDDKLDYKLEHKRGFIENHIFIFTERGCPYTCSFCIHSVINKMDDGYQRIRRRSVDHVLGEVEKRIEENGMRHFIMHDEIFAIQKKWIVEFAEKWIERFKPRGITFTGYVHPISTDRDMVAALFEAGMTKTGIGIQTGSSRTSKEVYDRPLHREKVIRMSEWLAEHPFESVQVDVISDSPYETDEDRRETLELLLDMKGPFHTETFGLQTYSTTELVNKKRLMKEVPWNERLFWNMLYHLTGTPFIRKETVLALSHNTYFRENPLDLEALVIDLNGEYFRRIQGFLRPGDEANIQEDAILAARRRAQAYNGAEGSIEEQHARATANGGNGDQWTGYRFKRVLKETVKKIIHHR